MVDAQAKEVLDLRARDQHGNPIREADHDRTRNEFDRCPKPRYPQDHEEDASHHRRHQEAVEAELSDDPSNDYNEGSRGSANLSPGTAEGGNKEPGDHGGVD